ncbi:MAG: helix-turn-helix domain-containing protein [Acidimicrobiia bacterium]|nr:helix-turn-helix domain-containing protein [Acidimicrobiia bacterium]
MIADRRALLSTFRSRLGEVLERSGRNRSQFAADTGLDRSTLTQLLSPTNTRLPRLETISQIAEVHQVSLDWLMGLSNAGPMQAEVMPETATLSSGSLAELEARLLQWFDEAIGYKVRYVPTTLPDLLKTSDVIDHEQRRHTTSSPAEKIEVAAARLAWTRDPSTNMEVCSSTQSLGTFARGEGVWAQLPRSTRMVQLDRMADLAEELYPSLRWFLFDGLRRYAAPVTIFGPIRAVLYLGQMYLALTSAEHVRELTRHFDDHIRDAVVQPPDVPELIRDLRRDISRP